MEPDLTQNAELLMSRVDIPLPPTWSSRQRFRLMQAIVKQVDEVAEPT